MYEIDSELVHDPNQQHNLDEYDIILQVRSNMNTNCIETCKSKTLSVAMVSIFVIFLNIPRRII